MPLLNVGDQAPGFSAQNQDGETVTLDQVNAAARAVLKKQNSVTSILLRDRES